MAKNVTQHKSGTGGQQKQPQSTGGKQNDKKSHSANKDPAHQASSNQTTATASATAQKAAAAAAANVDSKLLTPEQRRLASLMNDKIDVSDIEKKVNKIMELTGATKDKAIVALHDCANELDKAIDMILEGDSLNEAEWINQARKKKPKVIANKENDVAAGGRHLNGESRRNQKNSGAVGGPKTNQPRSKDSNSRGGRGGSGPKGERDFHSKSSGQSQSAGREQPNIEPAADDWGPAEEEGDSEQTSNRQAPRSYNNENSRSKFGDRGDRSSYSRGSYAGKAGNSSSVGSGRATGSRTYQNKNFKDSGGFPESIDTWTNSTVDQPPATESLTVGNWSDVADNEVISEDDYETGKTVETKVFTPSSSKTASANKQNELSAPKMPNLASIVSGVKPNLAAIVRGIPPAEPPKPLITNVEVTTTTRTRPGIQQQTSVPASSNTHHTSHMSNVSNLSQKSISSVPGETDLQLSSVANQLNSSQASSTISQEHQSIPQAVTSAAAAALSGQTTQPNKIDLSTLLKSPQQQHSTQQTSHPGSTNANQPLNALLSQSNLNSSTNTANQQRSQQNAAGAALLQQLTQQANQPQSSYRPIHYSKQASENIKSLVGIPSSGSGGYVPSSQTQASQQGQPLLDQPNNQRPQNSHQRTTSNQQRSIPSHRQRSKRIPESAVEMPNSDHISSLNVQFGALDCSTDSYLGSSSNEQQPSGPSFGDLQPPSSGNKPLSANQTSHHHQQQQQQQQAASVHPSQQQHQQANLNQMLNQVQAESSTNYTKTAPPELGQMASSLVSSHHQQLSESVLERVKQNSQVAGNNPSSHHHYSSQKPSGLYNQPSQHDSSSSGSQMYKYGSDATSAHYGGYAGSSQSNYSNYGQQPTSNTQQQQQQQQNAYGMNSSVGYNAYNSSSQVPGQQQTSSNVSNQQANGASSAHQKINLKDLETPNQQNTSNPTNLSGLVSSSTVTTNVLKNTLTATGKTTGLAPNVAPNVNPLLGTPQYLISQPGLSAFYPIAYDMPQMAGREQQHFAPYPQPGAGSGPEAKYASRSDAESSNVQSSQAPVTQGPGQHQIFSQFPPPYGYFFTGVNMMPPSLYQTAAPFMQVQPPNPGAASGSTPHNSGPATGAVPGGFSKGQSQPGYGSAFSNYNLAAQMQGQVQDYVSKSYGNSGPGAVSGGDVQNQSQSGQQNQSAGSKQNTGSSGSELNTSNMYSKGHAQLTKNYDKPNFQTGTPPPFNMASAQARANALGPYPSQYIPMLQQQSNPSMLHHSLQSDGSGSAGNQRSLGQSQKNTPAANKYYNWG